MNEQSFIYTENSGAKMKHHDSPVRRDRSPVMKSFFKIKQTADSEILPSRGIPQVPSNMLSDLQPKPAGASLKMNIPKNYFN